MRKSFNALFKRYYQFRYSRLERMAEQPHQVQQNWLEDLLYTAAYTEWGSTHGYRSIKSYEEFVNQVPLQDYESLKSCIHRMMEGEADILWPGQITRFSKSSGTTNDKSKFIPVSDQNFKHCHIKGTWDTMTAYYHEHPDSLIFAGKNFVMGGSYQQYKPDLPTIFGDVSALMIKDMPKIARPFFEPDFEISLMAEWEEKIRKMAEIATDPKIAGEVTMVGGVPTWVIVLFRQIIERTGKAHILEVWPNFEAFLHGGVGIGPYREQLQRYLPSPKVNYHEVYNASEGYFATQFHKEDDDLLLLLDNGVFYEFLPMEEWDKESGRTVPLEGVETGKVYAMIISTNAGLWRYQIGDTVQFTSTDPYKIQITGRTQQFINAFGEEVMVANTDKALAKACRDLDAIVGEYTVAPIYFQGYDKGGHEWLVEFEKRPADMSSFARQLDKNLQMINSDYEAKRYKSMALEQLHLHPIAPGTFHEWLKTKGKYGNQHKVPRLANNRKYVEDILRFSANRV